MKEITALRAGFSMGRAQGLAKVEEFPPYYYPGGLAAKQPQSHTESPKTSGRCESGLSATGGQGRR